MFYLCPQGPKTLAYNPAENALLVTSDADGGSYELYMIPKESARGDTAPVRALGIVRLQATLCFRFCACCSTSCQQVMHWQRRVAGGTPVNGPCSDTIPTDVKGVPASTQRTQAVSLMYIKLPSYHCG